jgi:rhodanese-related sulfurtransferase
MEFMKKTEYLSGNRLFRETTILIILAVTLAFIYNAISPKGIAFFGEWDKDIGVVNPKSKDTQVDHDLEIGSVQSAKRIFDTGNAVFVDVRSEDQYQDGHIKGAVMMPVNEFDRLIDAFQNQYPPETFLITYCSGRQCQDSHLAAQFFFENGYLNVSVFIDGFFAWESEGYPVERDDESNSE